jgi:hypothetical protein
MVRGGIRHIKFMRIGNRRCLLSGENEMAILGAIAQSKEEVTARHGAEEVSDGARRQGGAARMRNPDCHHDLSRSRDAFQRCS